MALESSKKENIGVIFQRIFQIRGLDIFDYGLPYIQRRIHGRMLSLGISELESYEEYIKSNANEYNLLLSAILGEESRFFRDHEAWEFLEQSVLPKILKTRENDEIRIWSVGCTNGEEAYSIALLLADLMKNNISNYKIKIYATDIDESALRIARVGNYLADQLIGLSDSMKAKYFSCQNSLFTISSNIRNLLIFGRHNIVIDPPISNIDLLLCRNVLLYLEPALRSKSIQNLRYALNENGYLWLGMGEKHIDNVKYGFKPLDTKWRFFRRLPNQEYYHLSSMEDENLEFASEEVLLENNYQGSHKFRSGLILLDENYSIVLYDRVAQELCLNKYLARKKVKDSDTIDNRLFNYGLIKADFTISFFDLNISDSIANLEQKIKQAEANGKYLVIDKIEQWISDKKLIYIRMTIIPLAVIGISGQGCLIYLEDVTSFQELDNKFNLTVKSLRNANDKLLSANKVFQKAIDELEIINNYLQSRNSEELILLNENLTKRTAELEDLSSQYQAILNSVNFGVMIISPSLFVNSINSNASKIIQISQDAIEGKSLFDFFDNEILSEIAERAIDAMKKGISIDYMIEKTNAKNEMKIMDILINPINGEKNKGVVLIIRERCNYNVDI